MIEGEKVTFLIKNPIVIFFRDVISGGWYFLYILFFDKITSLIHEEKHISANEKHFFKERMTVFLDGNISLLIL